MANQRHGPSPPDDPEAVPSIDGVPTGKSSRPPVDPTKNVLDLVRAESRRQDDMREMVRQFLDGMRIATKEVIEAKLKLQEYHTDAESKRIDQLAALRESYEKRIADMLRDSVQSTSSLVSTQLAQMATTIDIRVSKLEQFRWESGGASSISNPALAAALSEMSATIASLKTGGERTAGKAEITGPIWAFIGAVVVAVIGSIVVMIIETSKAVPVPPPVIYAPAAPVGVAPTKAP